MKKTLRITAKELERLMFYAMTEEKDDFIDLTIELNDKETK